MTHTAIVEAEGTRQAADDPVSPRRFLSTETAQVWAIDVRIGEPRYLPDGQAGTWRAEAKEHWACPVPECPSPSLTTVGSPKRRDHFRHLSGGSIEHEPESLNHIQGKAMLAAWVRTQAPEAETREEMSFKSPDTFRHRRADVGVTWPTGAKLAFEVEYKSPSEEDWRAKQVDYEQQGVATTWLFGHHSRHLNRWGMSDDMVRLQAIPQAAASRGLPVLMINPEDRTIGTVVVTGREETGRWWAPGVLPTVGRRLPIEGDRIGNLVVCLLDDCRLDPQRGLITRSWTRSTPNSASAPYGPQQRRRPSGRAWRSGTHAPIGRPATTLELEGHRASPAGPDDSAAGTPPWLTASSARPAKPSACR